LEFDNFIKSKIRKRLKKDLQKKEEMEWCKRTFRQDIYFRKGICFNWTNNIRKISCKTM